MGDEPRITTQVLTIVASMLGDPMASWYGLELVRETGLKSGTLYPLLARLERAGWLESHWEDAHPSMLKRPRRRLYRLTAHGEHAARHALDDHQRRLAAAAQAAPRWQPRPRGGMA